MFSDHFVHPFLVLKPLSVHENWGEWLLPTWCSKQEVPTKAKTPKTSIFQNNQFLLWYLYFNIFSTTLLVYDIFPLWCMLFKL